MKYVLVLHFSNSWKMSHKVQFSAVDIAKIWHIKAQNAKISETDETKEE